MLAYLSSLIMHFFKNPYYTGYIPDTRPQAEKDQDYVHEERITPAAASDPFGNEQITTSAYPYENQLSTSSCVPHGVGLALAIERKADANLYQRLAWIFNYRLRSNYPGEGSIFQNIFQMYRVYGAPLFTTLPTPRSESEANNLVLTAAEYNEGAIFKGLTYFMINDYTTIDTLAIVAQQGHAVPVLLFATFHEYSQTYPQIQNPKLTIGQSQVQHCVTILPNSGFMKDGKKYVVIQDSAWFGGLTLRALSEEFIKTRVFAAGYWDTVNVLGGGEKPKHTFTQTLRVGSKGAEVINLQKLLVSENLLPSDCVTGNFYGITLAGVKAFQSKYASDILTPQGLNSPTGFWGQGSIKKANEICG